MTWQEYQAAQPTFTEQGIIVDGKHLFFASDGDVITTSIEEIAERIGTVDRVLEVGYGMGYAARAIEKYLKPKQHIIVEANTAIAERAREEMALLFPGVEVVNDFLQSLRALEGQPALDLLYTDIDPIDPIFAIDDPDYSRIPHRWFADRFSIANGQPTEEIVKEYGKADAQRGTGFTFTIGTTTYHQSLYQQPDGFFDSPLQA